MREPDRTLELTPREFERLGRRILRRLAEHVRTLPEQPAHYVEGGEELAARLAEPDSPWEGTALDTLLDTVLGEAVEKTFNTASPGYLAFVPGGGLLHSALADLIANTINRYTGVWAAAPGLVQLESNVIRWFCRTVAYPDSSGGFLSTGGSLANFSAVVAARADRLPEYFLKGAIYVCDQVHHCINKAAMLAGFPSKNLRLVKSDDRFRLDPQDLRRRIGQDREAGWTPFLVVASAGTTNTGAVDDLWAVAEVCREEDLWLHVDAAYGGFFMLTERGRRAMRGLHRADSIALDPHKALFVPYGTGCLLARNPETLHKAHSVSGSYMPPLQDGNERVDFCEISPELSRDFRGLRVWLPLKMHGFEPFRRNLEEKLDLIDWAHEKLRGMPEIEIVAEPQLTALAFRRHPEGMDGQEALNQLNQDLLERINRQTRRVFLTPTRLQGRFVIRICVLSYRTHLERLEAALEDIQAAIAEQKGG